MAQHDVLTFNVRVYVHNCLSHNVSLYLAKQNQLIIQKYERDALVEIDQPEIQYLCETGDSPPIIAICVIVTIITIITDITKITNKSVITVISTIKITLWDG